MMRKLRMMRKLSVIVAGMIAASLCMAAIAENAEARAIHVSGKHKHSYEEGLASCKRVFPLFPPIECKKKFMTNAAGEYKVTLGGGCRCLAGRWLPDGIYRVKVQGKCGASASKLVKIRGGVPVQVTINY